MPTDPDSAEFAASVTDQISRCSLTVTDAAADTSLADLLADVPAATRAASDSD